MSRTSNKSAIQQAIHEINICKAMLRRVPSEAEKNDLRAHLMTLELKLQKLKPSKSDIMQEVVNTLCKIRVKKQASSSTIQRHWLSKFFESIGSGRGAIQWK